MFDLSKSVIDDIIFAMEDQDGEWQVDVETGRLVAREVACGDGDQVPMPRPETVAAPDWSPREGFKLMETFASQVRQPSARHALQEAISHGRGVFKAFKSALQPYPELEKSFREKKLSVMGKVIRDWYDDLRVAKGLERLGEVPEEVGEVLAGDLGFTSGLAGIARPVVEAFLAHAELNLSPDIPSALLARELRIVKEELQGDDWECLWIDNGEGGAVGLAAGLREVEGGQVIGRIFLVLVEPEFRHQGFEQALVERMAQQLGGDQGALVVVETPIFPVEGRPSLHSAGFIDYGARSWRRV